jgi:hypothetical protein
LLLNNCGWQAQFSLLNDGFFRSFKSTVNGGNGVQVMFGSDGNQGIIETSQNSPLFANSRLSINHGCGADVFVGNQSSGKLIANHALGVGTEDFGQNGAEFTASVFGKTWLNGDVLIGTKNSTDPPVKLMVNGVIHTKEVKITQNPVWADFVFKEGYQLKPLIDVEEFISLNSHLPGIPSEADIQREGLDLAKMTPLLLQKIEEMTLYLIQQEKRIAELELEVKEMGGKK